MNNPSLVVHGAVVAAFGDYNGSDFDFMGAVFMWLYCLVAQVILVNLLVAIYADQYTKVLESADAESAKMRLSSIFNYRAVLLAVPPPFNLPLTLYYLFAGEQIGLFRRLVTYIKTGGAAIATPMRVHPVMMAGFGSGGDAAVAKYPMDESVEAKKARRRYIERVNNEENAEARCWRRSRRCANGRRRLRRRSIRSRGTF